MKKSIISIGLFSLLGLPACKKEEEKKDNRTAKEIILNTGKWQLSGQTYQNFENGVADPAEDRYPDIEDCEKDDYTFFTTNKTIMTDEGPTKCYPSDYQQTTQGQWSLIENETKMRQTDFFNETTDWDIEQLDDNVFKISYSFIEGTRRQKSTSIYKHIK